MSDFQQTVDLREKMEKRRKPAPPQKPAAPLEKIYRPDGGAQPDLNKIIKPAAGRYKWSIVNPKL